MITVCDIMSLKTALVGTYHLMTSETISEEDLLIVILTLTVITMLRLVK